MHTWSAGYRATAATANLGLRVSSSRSNPPRTSSSTTAAAADRHRSTSAALFRYILGAQGQAATAAVRVPAGVDKSLSAVGVGCGLHSDSAHQIIASSEQERHRGSLEENGKAEGGLGKSGRGDMIGIGTRSASIGGRDTVDAGAGNQNMYAHGYPRHDTYSTFESSSSHASTSLYSLHYPYQQHHHQPQHETHAQAKAEAVSQTQTQIQIQPSADSASSTSSAHYAANSSQWPPMDYNPIALPGPPSFSPGWSQEDEMRRMRYFGAPTSAPEPLSSPAPAPLSAHGYYGMQAHPAHYGLPVHRVPEEPWAAPFAPPPPSYAHVNPHSHTHTHPRPHPSYPYAHTNTHTLMYPHHPPGGTMHFSSSASRFASDPNTDQGHTQVPTRNQPLPPSPAHTLHLPNIPHYSPRPGYRPAQHFLGRGQGFGTSYPPTIPPGPASSVRQQPPSQQPSKPQEKIKKKTDLIKLPPYSFLERSPKSKIIYVRTAGEADRAIVALRSALKTDPAHNQILGFDLEWKPKFKKGQSENPVALVQLASRNLIVLAQVSAMDCMSLLPLCYSKKRLRCEICSIIHQIFPSSSRSCWRIRISTKPECQSYVRPRLKPSTQIRSITN